MEAPEWVEEHASTVVLTYGLPFDKKSVKFTLQIYLMHWLEMNYGCLCKHRAFIHTQKWWIWIVIKYHNSCLMIYDIDRQMIHSKWPVVSIVLISEFSCRFFLNNSRHLFLSFSLTLNSASPLRFHPFDFNIDH